MRDERPISFVGETEANSETEEVYEFDEAGVITDAQLITHPGQEYALRTYAELIRDGTPTTIWQPLSQEYLAGDGENYDLSVRFEFSDGDKLRLRSENISQDYDYHHNVTIGIDYADNLIDRLAAALRRVA